MSKRYRRHLALEDEELEIEKLNEAKKASEQSSEFDNLYEKTKSDLVESKKEDEDTPETDVEADGEAPEGEDDSESPVDNEEGSEEESEAPVEDEKSDEEPEEESEDAKDEKVAKEDIVILSKFNIALEEEGKSRIGKHLKTAGSAVWAVGTFLYDHIKDLLVILVALGIRHGPTLVHKLYKGVSYLFCKIVQLSHSGYTAISKSMERRKNSFDNIMKESSSLKSMLENMEESGEESNEARRFTNEKVINSLKISNGVDLTANLAILQDFVATFIKEIDVRIKDEVTNIKHIIAYSQSNSVKVPMNLLQLKPFNTGMMKGSVEGYESKNDHLDSYIYKGRLPGDIAFIAYLPNASAYVVEGDANETDAVKVIGQAYSNASMILGFDLKSFKNIDSLDYMTKDQLSKYLDAIQSLANICIEHQKFYEDIMKIKKTLNISYKQYFLRLASSDTKVPIGKSLIEFIHIKTIVIDKVFILAAMDLHDYAAKVMVNALSYARDNVKRLQ